MRPVKIFISYVIEDEVFRDALIRHLSGLKRLGIVETWDHQQILPGKSYENETKQKLESAEIVIFLVSSYFMVSDYVYDVEIKNALQRYESGNQVIVPVLVQPCDFTSLSLSRFKPLPSQNSVTEYDNQEAAWKIVCLGLKTVIYEHRGLPLPDVYIDESTDTVAQSVEKITLHEFHSYTCNRRPQLADFESFYENQKNSKTQFYYVFGEEEQAHFGFVNRLAYEKGGHLLDIDNPSPKTSKLFIDDIIIENISGLEHLKKRLIRELFAKLNITVNACDPILNKQLDFILRESPVISQFSQSDYVCILLTIYEDEWDEDETPELTRWFIHEFCNTEMPENAPHFIFFFGIIYTDDDPEVKASVHKAVMESKTIKALPELEMVNKKDIIRWFRRYKIIAPGSDVRKSMIETYFTKKEEFEMETVQIALRKIIDQFNKK